MDFWDNVYEKVTNAASITAKKASELSDAAKLKYNLMREKAKLEDAYKELGELYYKQMKNCDYNDGKIALAYDKIEKSVIEIERLTNMIKNADTKAEMSSSVQCGNNGVSVCPKCGKRVCEKNPNNEK